MMQVKILGSGCANCERLEQVAREAAESLGIEAEFVKVTDFADIMVYGIMTTPALVVNEEVKVAGRVPSVEDVAKLLKSAPSNPGAVGKGSCGCGGCC